MHRCRQPKYRKFENLSGIWFHIAGIACLIWFLIRVAPAPYRSQYPCQQIAIPVAFTYIAFWSGIWYVLRLWIKKSQSHLSTATPAVIAALMMLVSIASIGFATNPQPTSYGPWNPIPNTPIGTPQGLHPGRVVWVWNPDATEEKPVGYWWLKDNNNQNIIDTMMASGIQKLAGINETTNAWESLFRYFNIKRGKGDVGYSPGEKIAIKINLNNCWDLFIDSYVKMDNDRDASPYVVKALLRQLTQYVGISQEDITVYDASRKMGNWFYNRVYYKEFPNLPLEAEFPDIHYIDSAGESPGREKAQPSNELIYFADASKLTRTLPTCVVDADYLINMPLLKMHPINHGVTLSGKNMFGTWIEPVIQVHPYHKNGLNMGNATPQTDLFAHTHIGGKTLLFLGDGLYSTLEDHCTLSKYQMYPFNNDWTNSLFFSQDPVAIDSVMYDFLYTEGAYPIEGSQNYLHQSAEPLVNTYDPENDGEYLSVSLGVHEHWNPNISIFSSERYAGIDGNGIEYIPVGEDYAQPGILLTKPGEHSFYFFGKEQSFKVPITVVIGSINVSASINGLEYPVDSVEFYIDNKLMHVDTQSPYSWEWKNVSVWRHTISIKAHYLENESISFQRIVWKFL